MVETRTETAETPVRTERVGNTVYVNEEGVMRPVLSPVTAPPESPKLEDDSFPPLPSPSPHPEVVTPEVTVVTHEVVEKSTPKVTVQTQQVVVKQSAPPPVKAKPTKGNIAVIFSELRLSRV